METLIILCIISVALNIAIYPLCKINYRIEDTERLAEGKINVKCQVMHSVLGRDLRDHVRMDNRIKPVAICVLIILLFIVATLIILGIFNS